ncbi:MAG: PorT family protein [Prevotella sp.]|nr:PorT family protein [Prevotella sp.]
MKKFTLLTVMLMAVITASAQQEVGTLTLTPRVGVASSNVSQQQYLIPQGSQNSKRVANFVAGADVAYQLHRVISLSGGVFYSGEGYKFPETDGLKLRHNLYFVNVPLLANFYVAPGLAVKTGVQPAWLIAARETIHVNHRTNRQDLNAYKTFNLSIPVGISYELGHVSLDLRYNIGLLNINDIRAISDSYRTSSLWLTLGYGIQLF